MSFRTHSACVGWLALVVACGGASGKSDHEPLPDTGVAETEEDGEDSDAREGGPGGERSDASSAVTRDGGGESATRADAGGGAGADAGAAAEAGAVQADAQLPTDGAAPGADGGSCAAPQFGPGPSDGGSDLDAFTGQDLGASCHAFDFDPGVSLVQAQLVHSRGAPPAGGMIMPGTYDLVAEYRYVTEHASAQDRINCESYDGAYWERLVITDSTWQVLNRQDNHVMGRLAYTYQVSGSSLRRMQTCPGLAPGMPDKGFAPFTATPAELHLFDAVLSPSLPCAPTVCEYEYIYKRKS